MDMQEYWMQVHTYVEWNITVPLQKIEFTFILKALRWTGELDWLHLRQFLLVLHPEGDFYRTVRKCRR